MKTAVDFDTVNRHLMQGLDSHVSKWLPGGKRNGHEYRALNPTRSDDRIGSFSINLNTGEWADFATDDRGRDPVSLYAYLFTRNEQGRAAKELAEELGIGEVWQGQPGHGSLWIPVVPVPLMLPEPPKAHLRRGRPEAIWTYRDERGAILGYVCRFKNSGGGKEILPLTWCRNSITDQCEWRWMAQPRPRPLYGLDRLASRPDAVVLVVEGEKCADVGQEQLPDFAVVTWPGGARAVEKADWSPLKGRRVIVWPDCDAQQDKGGKLMPEAKQPGVLAAEKIAHRLKGMGCEASIVKIPGPGKKPSGWDIFDAVQEGLKGKPLGDFIIGNLRRPAQAGPDMAAFGDGDSWRYQLLRKDDRLIDCRENIYLILKHHPLWRDLLWVDEFSIRLVKRRPAPWDAEQGFEEGADWDHNDDLRLGLWLAQNERLIIRSADNLSAAVGWAASESPWHPVRQYFDSLEWDRESRLESWISSFVGVKSTEYVRKVSSMFLIGMVARIYRPGCIMRAMPIFEGSQYQGKSSVLRILGGKWFGDSPIDLNNKDSFQLIQGKMLYEIAELDAFNRAETTRIKSFISSPVDRFRAPYERSPRDWPRQTVFVGTTNQSQYFKDQTGNSRYWPLQVKEGVDIDGLAMIRDQLFAEAVARFRSGERWHPTRDEQHRLFEPEQRSREIEDPWEYLIIKWLGEISKEKVTACEVLTECLKVEVSKFDSMKTMSSRVGTVMNRLGWERKRETTGARGYYYQKPGNTKEKGIVPF